MMAKRLAVVVAMAAMTATTAVPAFAQQAQEAGPTGGTAASGQYAPEAAAQGGEDCTLTTYPEQPCPPQEEAGGAGPGGAIVPGEVGAGSGQYGPGGSTEAQGEEAIPEDRTLNFELAVEGEPPAGATFSAVAPGANITELTDPDGDDVYTGSLTATAGSYPRCVPVEVFGKNSPDEVSYEIWNESRFCFKDGDTFSASYSFGDSGSGGTGGGSGGSKGGAMVSGGSVVSSGGTAQGASPIASVLPTTGGVLPVAGAAGALLLAGGLLLRRISH